MEAAIINVRNYDVRMNKLGCQILFFYVGYRLKKLETGVSRHNGYEFRAHESPRLKGGSQSPSIMPRGFGDWDMIQRD